MINKDFCMSSYLAFRYIEKEGMDFKENMYHHNYIPLPENERVLVYSAQGMDQLMKEHFSELQHKGIKLGILLSGGMDSANCASYMAGGDAYTFRFIGGRYQEEELLRAEYYAKSYGLKLHYVDIDWSTVENYLEPVMRSKAAPVHSIEPQILQAALQAKADGVEMMVVGESADLIFGGMDQLLGQDWKFDDFKKRYMFINPDEVLVNPVDMSYLFERYRQREFIDFLSFLDDVFAIESSSSYLNAFNTAEMPYIDPYAKMKMGNPLDLDRVRRGESKYLVRELFSLRYPGIAIPEKIPMPRPVDLYFKDWTGPVRAEFKRNIDISRFTGNQKWQLYCLEQFLNLLDK